MLKKYATSVFQVTKTLFLSKNSKANIGPPGAIGVQGVGKGVIVVLLRRGSVA